MFYKNGKKLSKYERRKPISALTEIFMRTRKIQISMQRVRRDPNMPA